MSRDSLVHLAQSSDAIKESFEKDFLVPDDEIISETSHSGSIVYSSHLVEIGADEKTFGFHCRLVVVAARFAFM